MFTLWQAYRTEWIRPPVLYVDALDTWVSFSSVKLLATEASETLSCAGCSVEFMSASATYPFPLSGSDFLTALTGTLRVFVPSPSCTRGLTVIPLLNAGPSLPPLTGCHQNGTGLRTAASLWTRTLPTYVQAQSFEIPSALRVSSSASVITSGGR